MFKVFLLLLGCGVFARALMALLKNDKLPISRTFRLRRSIALDTLVEVLKSLNLRFNLVALVALNLAFPLMWSLKFQEVPVLYVLLA